MNGNEPKHPKEIEFRLYLIREYLEKTNYFPDRKTIYLGCPIGEDLVYLCSLYRKDLLEEKYRTLFENSFLIHSSFKKMLAESKLNQFIGWLRWQHMLGILQRYIEENQGNMPNSSTVYEEEKIGKWLANQWSQWRRGLLTPLKIHSLQTIGVSYHTERNVLDNQIWKEQFDEYQNSILFGKPLNKKIKRWIGTQKQKYQDHFLLEERRILLATIDPYFKEQEEIYLVKASDSSNDKRGKEHDTISSREVYSTDNAGTNSQ